MKDENYIFKYYDKSSLFATPHKEPYVVQCQLATTTVQVAVVMSGLPLLFRWWWLENRFQAFEQEGFSVLVDVWVLLGACVFMGICVFNFIRVTQPHTWSIWDSNLFSPGPQLKLIQQALSILKDRWRRLWQHFRPDLSSQVQDTVVTPASKLGSRADDAGPSSPSHAYRLTDDDDIRAAERQLSSQSGGSSIRARDQLQRSSSHPNLLEPGVQERHKAAAQAHEASGSKPVHDISRLSAPEAAKEHGGIRALVAALQRSNSIADIASSLFAAAEHLLGTPQQELPFVEAGGLVALLQHVPAVRAVLEDEEDSAESASAVLQLSWVTLLLSNGGVDAKEALIRPDVEHMTVHSDSALPPLVGILQAVTDAPHLAVELRATVMRNMSWALFALCDASAQLPGAQGVDPRRWPQAAMATSCLTQLGVLPMMAQQLGMNSGPMPAPYAASLLAVVCQQAAPASSAALAKELLLTPDCLHGLCYVLSACPLNERCRVVLTSLVHYMVSRHALEFVRLLVTEQLLGSYLTAIRRELGHMLVCQLISGEGQQQLEEIDRQYELDVPLALAQAAAADCHVVLQPPQPPDGGEELPGTCTCALTCRLLLVGNRVQELCSCFFSDLLEMVAPPDAPKDAPEQPSPAVLPSATIQAVEQLLGLVMREELEIQKFAHLRGHMSDSSDSASVSHGEIAAGSPAGASAAHVGGMLGQHRGVEAAQNINRTGSVDSAAPIAPHPEPVNDPAMAHGHEVPSGSAVADRQMPASFSTLTGSHEAANVRMVRFAVGGREVSVTDATYAKLKACSSLLHSVLSKSAKGAPIEVMGVPSLTDDGNHRAFCCIVEWAAQQRVQGLAAADACDLWTAADFYQVDALQSHCEDVIAASLGDSVDALAVAVELAASHPMRGDRLLNLCVRHIMTRLRQLLPNREFCALLQQHSNVLEHSFAGELRDRLSALCAINGGVGLPDLPNVRSL